MRRPAVALLFALTLHPFAFAQQPTFAEAAASHRYRIAFDGGRLTGEGADFLVREGTAAQFVLIGEDHGIAELPLFAEALFKALQPAGYHHFVVETGPVTAEIVAGLATSRDPDRAFLDFLKKYPFSMPFFTLREEAQLARTVTGLSPARTEALWGIDQEFILSPIFLFERLADAAKDPKIKTALLDLAAKESAAVRSITPNSNPGAISLFMMDERVADLRPFREHFRTIGDAKALTILDEIEASRAVYRAYQTGRGYDNNFDRSKLNKRHFMSYYERASRAGRGRPKVMAKMGANHLARGMSPMNVLDIGNLISELADANGTASFHLLVVAASGTQNMYVPFRDASARRAKIEPSLGAEYAPLALDGAWTVVDLRPLRSRVNALSGGDAKVKQTILSYDAVLVVPEARAATLIE
jgi:hypothetical protein